MPVIRSIKGAVVASCVELIAQIYQCDGRADRDSESGQDFYHDRFIPVWFRNLNSKRLRSSSAFSEYPDDPLRSQAIAERGSGHRFRWCLSPLDAVKNLFADETAKAYLQDLG